MYDTEPAPADTEPAPVHPRDDPAHIEKMTRANRFARAQERCRKMRDAWPPFTPEQAEKLALILTGQAK